MTIEQALALALQHHQAGRLAEAEALYRQILAAEPRNADALHLLGVVARQVGQNDVAVDLIRQALALRPNFPEAYSNLGNALRDKGQLDKAVAAYRQAIAVRPNFSEAYSNLGNALRDKGQRDQAIAAYRHAIALRPGYAEAHYNLGVALEEKRKLDEAIASYRQAIAFRSNFAEAHNNLGNAFKDNGQLDEAIACYRQAVRLKPDYAEAHSNLIVTCNYHPACDAGMIHAELRRWNERHAEPHKKLIRPHHNNRDPSRPLRIGYVSADFYKHASAFFLLPLFRCHDRRQFELFGYSHGNCSDEVTQQMKDHMQHWRTTVGMTDAQAAAQVRQDQIDILVDLKLHTADNHLLLFAQKPAPVQATWLGYPGSTGMDAIDYRLTDPYLDPPGQNDAYYSERSIHLPDTFWCYDPLSGEPSVNAPPCVENGFITFGCLNNFCKINDAVLSLWAGVLQTVSGSRLLLMAPEGSARERVMARLIRDGIGSGRVEFVPKQFRSGYLTTYHRIDISLDTFPYNGHTTSLDSLWMGVPVITLVGATAFGRAGLSQLTNLGLTELVARTPEQYIQIAADLAKDLPRLTELRRTLRPRMQASPLMDAPRFARNVEAAYRQMWRNWCAQGANPE